jgi:hypothetical protein
MLLYSPKETLIYATLPHPPPHPPLHTHQSGRVKGGKHVVVLLLGRKTGSSSSAAAKKVSRVGGSADVSLLKPYVELHQRFCKQGCSLLLGDRLY